MAPKEQLIEAASCSVCLVPRRCQEGPLTKDSLHFHQNTMPVSSIERLFQLQRIDSQLAQLARDVTALDDGSGLLAEVRQLEADKQRAEADLRSKQAQLRNLELDLQSTTAKAAKVEEQLYSGRIGNPKELSAMQDDLQVLGRQRQRLEDDVLALMEDIERRVKETQGFDGSVETAQHAYDTTREEFTRRQDALARESQRVEGEREVLVTAIDEAQLRRYQLLRERKGGVAVALVVRGICEGCHVAIPEKRLAQLLDPETERIYTCEGCGRILHAKGS